MQRQLVSSSNLRSVGYDAATQVLEIEFNSGGIYQYFSVPAAIHQSLMAASSKGSYFHQHIKGRYTFQRIR
ncbi:MAG: KTSC domain-containing protein [Chloroflexota bacterium]